MRVTYLSHHGIKGQRWGVRRYQNEDGSLTSAGKQKLAKDVKDVGRESSKAFDKASRLGSGSRSKTVNKKDYSKMTDTELRNKVNRLNLEQRYGELTGDSKKVRSGADWLHEGLQTLAIATSVISSAAGIYLALKNKKG